MDDPLIVGEVIGCGFHAVIAIARGYHFVHHTDRRESTQFRISILRVDRQVVFDFLHVIAEEFQLRGFGIVADVDVGFEGGFVAEDLVVISFVGAEGDVDGGVEIHPGDVAAVVVV